MKFYFFFFFFKFIKCLIKCPEGSDIFRSVIKHLSFDGPKGEFLMNKLVLVYKGRLHYTNQPKLSVFYCGDAL